MLTIVSSLKHKHTRPLYIFIRENFIYFQQGKGPPSRQAQGGDLIT